MSVGDDYVSEIFYQYLETPDAHTSGIKNQSYHRGGPLDRRVEHSSACCSCTVSVETRFGGAALAMHSTKDLIKVFRCWRCRPCRARSYWLSWNTLHRWSAVAVAKHLCIGSTWGTCAHSAKLAVLRAFWSFPQAAIFAIVKLISLFICIVSDSDHAFRQAIFVFVLRPRCHDVAEFQVSVVVRE